MLIIRRVILIIVLSWLAFVFYRILNPDWADALVAKIRWFFISSNISAPANLDYNTWATGSLSNVSNVASWQTTTWYNQFTGVDGLTTNELYDDLYNDMYNQDTTDISNDIIQDDVSIHRIKWDLNYKNSDYNFSIKFPWSRDWYQIEIYTWTIWEYHLIFSFDNKDYFILYIIENNYYNSNKQTKFSHTTYIAQNSKYTFVYVPLETDDSKSNNISYIIKTFRLLPKINTSQTNTTQTITPAKQKTPSDPNYLKQIFDSFVK